MKSEKNCLAPVELFELFYDEEIVLFLAEDGVGVGVGVEVTETGLNIGM